LGRPFGISGLAWLALRASLGQVSAFSRPARTGFLPVRPSIFIPENRRGRNPFLGTQMLKERGLTAPIPRSVLFYV